MIALLWLFLEKTPYGAIIKAGAHDSEMVRALGINLSRLRLVRVRARRRARGDRRRRHGADLGHAAAGRRRRRRAGVPHHRARRRRQPLGRGRSPALLVGLVVGLTGAYASEWSLLSMYLLFIAVVTFRSRGLFGKKSVLDT